MTLSSKFVDLIEKNADELSKKWMKQVKSHSGTPTYHDYDEKKLYERAFSVYSQLGRWLSHDTTKADIKKIYTALGEQRRKECFKLSEVIQALIITRRILWFKVQDEGFLDNVLDLNLAMGLNNQVILFFDRAIYFTGAGFEAAG
jgi:hypothetical protein